MNRTINIYEDHEGVVVQIQGCDVRVQYKFESMLEALEALPNLDELQ